MFDDILAVFTGSPKDKWVLDFGLQISKSQHTNIYGLYISTPADRIPDFRATHFQKSFLQRCSEDDVTGEIAVAFGEKPIPHILRRAEFTNLVIIPFGSDAFSYKNAQQLITQYPKQTLLIPGEVPKSFNNALIINCSTQSRRKMVNNHFNLSTSWQIDIKISTILNTSRMTGRQSFHSLKLHKYDGVPININRTSNHQEEPVLQLVEENNCDLIIFGGIESPRAKKIFAGSVVKEIIKKSKTPILICQSQRNKG